MNNIRKVVLPEGLAAVFEQKTISSSSVAAAEPYGAKSFEHLMRLVAGVSAYNPNYAILFRGQPRDYRIGSKRASSILPGIYRNVPADEAQAGALLAKRFETLRKASDLLVRALDGKETKKFVARRVQQWAMIQHYGICDTPLLDLTRSLRVACWFALDGAGDRDLPVLYVFGMPYMHDRIALDSNDELFQMNLMSLLPPNAERPAFQEGVLVGYEQPDKKRQAIKESDFSRRLLAKISLPCTSEFRDSIRLERNLIYPTDDPFLPIADSIRSSLNSNDEQPVGDVLRESILRSGEAMAKAYIDAIAAMERNLSQAKR